LWWWSCLSWACWAGVSFFSRSSTVSISTEMLGKLTTQDPNHSALIAPCGMNCGLCYAFLRSRNRCPGCRGDDRGKPKTRVSCRIKKCEVRPGDFCTGCASFPCERLSGLDKRYRLKYGMSMIENLRSIEADGLRGFVEREKSKWACPGCGETICVHKACCLICRRQWR
jgi:hypothetical protein